MAWILMILGAVLLVIAFTPSKSKSLHNNENNQQILNWAISVISTVEKASGPLGLYSCSIQVIYGNELRISIQDWYDEMVEKHGCQYGLDKYFDLKPVEGYDDIYVTNETPCITGSCDGFMKMLISEMEQKGISGYQYNKQRNMLSKSYR